MLSIQALINARLKRTRNNKLYKNNPASYNGVGFSYIKKGE